MASRAKYSYLLNEMLMLGIEVNRKIKGARNTPSLRDERAPTEQELRRIFLSTDKKAKLFSFLAY